MNGFNFRTFYIYIHSEPLVAKGTSYEWFNCFSIIYITSYKYFAAKVACWCTFLLQIQLLFSFLIISSIRERFDLLNYVLKRQSTVLMSRRVDIRALGGLKHQILYLFPILSTYTSDQQPFLAQHETKQKKKVKS